MPELEKADELSTRERFGDIVCGFRPHLLNLFSVLIVLIVLTLISLAISSPGTASYVIIQFNIILQGTLLGSVILVFYFCRRRD